MARTLLLAFTSSVEGKDDQFNDWYDNQHLGDLLALPGVVSATRYAISPQQLGAHSPSHSYLAIYEIESDRLDEAIAELGARRGTELMPLSDAMVTAGEGAAVAYVYEPIAASG